MARKGSLVNVKNRINVQFRWIKKIPEGEHWVVIDGDFAWLYDNLGFSQKRDASEYDPKLTAQFDAARAEAKKLLDKKGIELIDSSYPLDIETQRILQTKFKINWKRPDELINGLSVNSKN